MFLFQTVNGLATDITSTATLATFTATRRSMVRLRYLFESLDGAAATFTFTLTHKDGSGNTLHQYVLSASKSPATATRSVQTLPASTPNVGIWMHAGETLDVQVASSNASDTAVTWELNFVDPLLEDVVACGTAQSGSTSTTIKLASGTSFSNDGIKGCLVAITGGTGFGQSPRVVTAWNNTTKVATVSPAWTTTPDTGTAYDVRIGSANLVGVNGDAASAQTTPIDANVTQISGSTTAADYLESALPQTGSIRANVHLWSDGDVSDPDFYPQVEVYTKTGFILASNGLASVTVGGLEIRKAIGRIAAVVCGTIPASGTGAAGSTSEVFTLWDGTGTVTIATPNTDGARTSVAYAGSSVS